MYFDGSAILLSPIKGIDAGTYEITVILNDGFQDMLVPCTFKITVNEAPHFEEDLIDQTVELN